jgi:hypothetical protein
MVPDRAAAEGRAARHRAAIVSGLKGGLEEVYVGDVAEEIRQRLAANPKALERELDR